MWVQNIFSGVYSVIESVFSVLALWDRSSRSKMTVDMIDTLAGQFPYPLFRLALFLTPCSILSHMCSSCHTPSGSNLCWIGLLFYHRWHVFYYFKKKKTNALDTIISGHVGRWPYFRPFKTIGETKWKLPGTFIWNFDYYKVIPVLQAIDKGNTNWRLWDLM